MECTYSGNRGETIIAYLYDDITPLERGAFESHLGGCEACRDELAELRGVRAEMGQWTPPAFRPQSSVLGPQSSVVNPAGSRRSSWAEMPVWMQTAAALLVVGVAAGAANVTVRHDATGFNVSTGWLQPAPARAQAADAEPWRAELAKLESEIQSSRASAPAVQTVAAVAPARSSAGDDELLRKVKALLGDSEKKEENELALRIGQVVRDRQVERATDLANIQRYLNIMQANTTNTGFEVRQLRQNQDTLLHAVSQPVPVGNRN